MGDLITIFFFLFSVAIYDISGLGGKLLTTFFSYKFLE